MYTILAVFFFFFDVKMKPLIDHYTIRLNHVYESSSKKKKTRKKGEEKNKQNEWMQIE